MISYEVNTSPFYKANEEYCLRIEQLFHSLNAVCDGFCNSWGYEFNTRYTKNNITFDLRFYKETITRNSWIIPKDSAIIEGIDFTISPLHADHKLKIYQSKFKRLFMAKEMKSLISTPYCFKSNVSLQTNDILKWISLFEKYDMYFVSLKNGELLMEINHRVEEPLMLISELEPMIKFYI